MTSRGRTLLALFLALWWLEEAGTSVADETKTLHSTGGEHRPRFDHAFFLKQIFDKYGHDGIMTFEGFEHLLESLGLGQLEFERRHGVALHRAEDGSFREVHDALRLHTHAHDADANANNTDASAATATSETVSTPSPTSHAPRARRSPAGAGEGAAGREASQRCLSPREMLVGLGLQGSHGVAIDANSFLMLCPVIVYELDQRTCYLTDAPTPPRRGPHPAAWRLATLSILAASVVGLLAAAAGGLLLGCSSRALPAMDALVAVGAGTLCGDALLHLLPHVFSDGHDGGGEGEGEAHSQGAVLRAAAAFTTIAALFALEAVLRRRGRKHSHTHAHAHAHAHRDAAGEEHGDSKGDLSAAAAAASASAAWEVAGVGSVNGEGAPNGRGCSARKDEPMLAVMVPAAPPEAASSPGHGHSHGGGSGGGAAAGVWMVLLGDGVHNLTDGLAVGAAFCDDPVAGFATALAVFCHELPHEFGDFAALLKSGMSLRRALLCNVLSSLLSFVGMALGLMVGNLDSASQWIYAITAGSFIYIALVDLIPDLIRNTSQSVTAVASCLQLLGIFIGGGIMLTIALYEDVLRTLFE